jgi:hypothetical protein
MSFVNPVLLSNFKDARILLSAMLAVDKQIVHGWFADPTCLFAFTDLLNARVPEVVNAVKVANVVEQIGKFTLQPIDFSRPEEPGVMNMNILNVNELLSAIRFCYGKNSPSSLLTSRITSTKRYTYKCEWCLKVPEKFSYPFEACRFSADEDPKFFDHKCKVMKPKKERPEKQWSIKEEYENLKTTIFTMSDPPSGHTFLSKLDGSDNDMREHDPSNCESLTDALVYAFIDGVGNTFDVVLDDRDPNQDPSERKPLIAYLIESEKVQDRRDKSKDRFKLSALPAVVVDIPKFGVDMVVPQLNLVIALLYTALNFDFDMFNMLRTQIQLKVLINAHPAFKGASADSHVLWSNSEFKNAFMEIIKDGHGERALNYPGQTKHPSTIVSSSLWSVVANCAAAIHVFDDVCEGTRSVTEQLAKDTGREYHVKDFSPMREVLTDICGDLCGLVTGPLKDFSSEHDTGDFKPAALHRSGECVFIQKFGDMDFFNDKKYPKPKITAEIKLMSSNWRLLQGDQSSNEWVNKIFHIWMNHYSPAKFGRLTDNRVFFGQQCKLVDISSYSYHRCLGGKGATRNEVFGVSGEFETRISAVKGMMRTQAHFCSLGDDDLDKALRLIAINGPFKGHVRSEIVRILGLKAPDQISKFKEAWTPRIVRKWGEETAPSSSPVIRSLLNQPVYVVHPEVRDMERVKRGKNITVEEIVSNVPGLQFEINSLTKKGKLSDVEDLIVNQVLSASPERYAGKNIIAGNVSTAVRLSDRVIVYVAPYQDFVSHITKRAMPAELCMERRFFLKFEAGQKGLTTIDNL